MHIIALSLPMLLLGVPSSPPPVVSTTIDFMDSVWDIRRVWTEDDTEALMKRLAEAGVKRVYLRFANGVTYYPSKVTKMYTDDGREPGGRLLAQTIRSYDVLESHIRIGHKYGLQMYFWEPIFDDEITSVQLNGAYPMKSPFTIEHPEYQMAHRRLSKILETQPRARHIGTIKLVGDSDRPTRIDKAHLELYFSNDNLHYTRYEGPWEFRNTLEGGLRTLILSGLDLTARFVKVHCTFDDDRWTFSNRPEKFVRVFSPGGEELTGFSVLYIENDNRPEQTFFSNSAEDFALDYKSRSLGICFDYIRPYLGGVLCYSYPEARAFRLAMIREVVENYDIDGVAFSIRSHSSFAERDNYGFNEPIVAEYKRRYGVNILTEDYDPEKLAEIRGEGVTQLLRDVSAYLKPRGLPLQMMIPTDPEGPDTARRRLYGNWLDFDWPAWTREGIVDGLILDTTGPPLAWDVPWRQQVRRIRQATRRAGTEIVIHYLINAPSVTQEPFEHVMSALSRDRNVDAIELYEEASLWPTSSRGAGFLKGLAQNAPSPLE